MNFSKENARAKSVWFDDSNIWISLVDGRQLSVPKAYFPKLDNAAKLELDNYELSGKLDVDNAIAMVGSLLYFYFLFYILPLMENKLRTISCWKIILRMILYE